MNERHAFELTLPVGPNDHAQRPGDAPVTLVEYGDFECPYCKQAAPAMKILLARFATPTFFLHRRILDASYGLQSVATAVEQALSR